MAARFGISVAMLTKIERGTRGPSPAALEMYSKVTSVPLLELLAQVAVRHREHRNPFDALLAVELPEYVRALDGPALYADIPARRMPKVLPVALTDAGSLSLGAPDTSASAASVEEGDAGL